MAGLWLLLCLFIICCICDGAWGHDLAGAKEACNGVLNATVTVNGGTPVLTLTAKGTRNYTCATPRGPTPIGDDQGATLAVFAPLGSSNYSSGTIFFDTDEHVVVDVNDPVSGLSGVVRLLNDAPAYGSPTYQMSPKNDSIAWARYLVLGVTAGGLENVTYVTRVNTEGGLRPETCLANKTTAEIPFQADYVFYECSSAGFYYQRLPSISTLIVVLLIFTVL